MAVKSNERELGAMSVHIDEIKKRQAEQHAETEQHREEVKEKLEKLGGDIQEIKDMVNQVKGGWRVLAFMATAAGIIGGLISKFASMLIVAVPK